MVKKLFQVLFMIPVLSMADDLPLIQTVDMVPLNTETYGIHRDQGPKIPTDIWKNLERQQIADLLKHLPPHQPNSILGRIQKSLLLASTKVPSSSKTLPEAPRDNMLKLRILHLKNTWHTEEAYLLAKRHPDVLTDEEWGWLEFSYYLQLENYQQALKIAKDNFAKKPEGMWSKAMIGLQLLKGEKDAALLGLSLMEENPSPENNTFMHIAKSVAQGTAIADDFSPTDMIELKLWLKGREKKILQLSPEFLPVLIASKEFKSLEAKEKLLAAEVAFKQGILSLGTLKELYQEHGKTSEQEEKVDLSDLEALTKEGTKEGLGLGVSLPPVPFDAERNDPVIRAQLYTKIQSAKDMREKALFIAQFIQHTLKHQLSHLGHVIIEHLKTVSVQKAFEAHAPSFAEVLLRFHEQDLGTRWLSFLTVEDKKVLAPLILIGLDSISLEAKQNLFSLWYAQTHEAKKTPVACLMTLGIFEAMVPGITKYRMTSIRPSVHHSRLKTPDMLWQLPLALSHQHGMALIYALILGADMEGSKEYTGLPLLLSALKTLGYGKEAKELALLHLLSP